MLNDPGVAKRISVIILTVLLLLVHLNVSGQKQKVKNESWYDDKYMHFGFTLGFNAMDFNITPSSNALELLPEVSVLNPGINIQIVVNARLADHFDLRFLPGVSFGQRTIRFYTTDRTLYQPERVQRLESSFLEFPLLLKFKGDRLNNVRPYVIGGLNYRYDLAAKKEFDDEKSVYLKLKRPDLYYEAGAGLDFYLTYFKLSIELKMSRGLGNVLVMESDQRHPEFFNAIEKIKSQIWILSFHFE
jgi:hypothetical protein